MIQKVNTLEALLDKNDVELRAILENNINVRDEELRRLVRAMGNLRRCRDTLKCGEIKEPMDLFWDSWDRHPLHHRPGTSPRSHRSIAKHAHHTTRIQNPPNGIVQSPIEISPPEAIPSRLLHHNHHHPYHFHHQQLHHSQAISPEDSSVHTLTPSPSPPNSPSSAVLMKQNKKGFPTTPPPKKKHQTLLSMQQQQHQKEITNANNNILNNVNANNTNANSNDPYNSLTKSKSHESQLLLAQQQQQQQQQQHDANHQNYNTSNGGNNGMPMPTPRTRLHTDGSAGKIEIESGFLKYFEIFYNFRLSSYVRADDGQYIE